MHDSRWTHEPGENRVKTWCESVRRGVRLKSVAAALLDPRTADLYRQLSQVDGAIISHDAAALLVSIHSLHPEQRGAPTPSVDFVDQWGAISPRAEHSININESRFAQWASSCNWNELHENTLVGIKCLYAYNRDFDIVSLYRWIHSRSRHVVGFFNPSRTPYLMENTRSVSLTTNPRVALGNGYDQSLATCIILAYAKPTIDFCALALSRGVFI